MLGCGAMTFGVRVRTPKHPLGLSLLHPPKTLDLWHMVYSEVRFL